MKKVKGSIMAITMAAVMVAGSTGPALAEKAKRPSNVRDVQLVDPNARVETPEGAEMRRKHDAIEAEFERAATTGIPVGPKKEMYIRGTKPKTEEKEETPEIELIKETPAVEVEETPAVEEKETKTTKLEWDADKAAHRLSEKGIVSGYGDGNMGLEDDVTRAQMAAILARAFATEEETEAASMTKDIKFKDVATDAWYAEVVNVSYTKGWVVGDGKGNFRPNDPVQYREAMTMVMRALGYTEELVTGEWPQNYVGKAEEMLLTSGVYFTDTEVMHEEDFTSRENAPRGDIFIVLDRVMDYDNMKVLEKYAPKTE